jgi:hypothetical protein
LEARKAARKLKKNPGAATEIEPTQETKATRQQPKKKPKKKRN